MIEVAQEAEKEREIVELWSEGLRALDSKEPSEAAAKFKMIIEKKPNSAGAYKGWGGALSKMSDLKGGDEELLNEAIRKYKKSIEMNPLYHEVYNNWGAVLATMSALKGGDQELLEESITKFKKAIEIKADHHEAYGNWGSALGRMSDLKDGDEDLLKKAIGKYKKSIEINPDQHEAYCNWGVALGRMSTLRGGDKALYKEAEEVLLRGEKIRKGSGAYDLACVSCRLADEEECKKWLKLAEEEGTLETKDHAMKDDDLRAVRDEEWFKELKWATSK